MSDADLIAIARRYAEAFNTGDPAVADALTSAETVFHLNGVRYPPGSSFAQRLTSFRTAFPDYQLTVDAVHIAGDTVILHYTGQGTHRGELRLPTGAAASATGRTMTYSGISILRVAQGRVAEEWTVADLLSAFQQLGLLSGPTTA